MVSREVGPELQAPPKLAVPSQYALCLEDTIIMMNRMLSLYWSVCQQTRRSMFSLHVILMKTNIFNYPAFVVINIIILCIFT